MHIEEAKKVLRIEAEAVSALLEHKTAAPENAGEPAKIKICPKSPLFESAFRRNNRAGNRIGFYMRNRYLHVYFFAFAVQKYAKWLAVFII